MYYLLYGISYEIPSNVAIGSELPSLGRIRLDSIAPPRSLTSFKQSISRVERNPVFAWRADFFTDNPCNTPLNESHISIPNGPGRSPNEPLTIILRPPIPDGRYIIRNRAINRHSRFLPGRGYKIYWSALRDPFTMVNFFLTNVDYAKRKNNYQVNDPFFNYSSCSEVKISFESGTLQMIIMVTSP